MRMEKKMVILPAAGNWKKVLSSRNPIPIRNRKAAKTDKMAAI